MLLLVSAGVYRGEWRYISVGDLIAIAKAVTVGSLLIAFSSFLLRRLGVRSIFTLEWLEGVLREKIEALVRGHPGAGKTIYPPVRRKEAQP